MTDVPKSSDTAQTAARPADTAIRALKLPADGSDHSLIQRNMTKTTDMMRATLRLGTKEAGIEDAFLEKLAGHGESAKRGEYEDVPENWGESRLKEVLGKFRKPSRS
ncbi:hypothetical protein OEA41_001365 [Lepraria neglecta]|uniref:Uncharacterized protein n=1 Tax=Lepraria neglecta TaxID=209136 RepID=A0AAE0DLG1_9LECA|nr:hypothetical protein OEA41_001365 [Lepraria neglecta]